MGGDFFGEKPHREEKRNGTRIDTFNIIKENQKMNIEQQIEFDKIKEIWMNLAVTAQAKERIKETSFYLSELELRKQLRDTTDARLLMEKMGTPPLQSVDEIKDILTAAEKGDCLTPYQLERVEAVLAAIRRLKDYLERGKLYDNPLSFYEENFDAQEEMGEEIARQIRCGAVDDYASKELLQIRGQITKCEEEMKQRAALFSGKKGISSESTGQCDRSVCHRKYLVY